MATTQLPINGVFDKDSGAFIGVAVPGDDEELKVGGSSSARNGVVSILPKMPAGARYGANSSSFFLTTCKGGFVGVRLGFRNNDTTAPMTITAKACSLPTLNTDPRTVTPTVVTFNGSVTGTIPQATTVTENGNVQTVDGYLWSDFIPLPSVDRTDIVGADPILYFRAASAEGIYYTQKDNTLANYVAAGYVIRSGVSSTDGVANWSTQAMSDSTAMGPCEVDFYSGGKSCSIAVFADSLAAGVSDSINYPLKVSPILAAAGVKAHIANHAQAGRYRTQFSQQLRKVVQAKKPQIVIVHNFTVNSSGNMTTVQQLAHLAGDLEFITQNGGKPVIVLMHGQVAAAQRTIEMYSGIYPIVDMNALLCAPYGTIKDEYCRDAVTDRTHLNDAGAAIVAAAVASEIAKLV